MAAFSKSNLPSIHTWFCCLSHFSWFSRPPGIQSSLIQPLSSCVWSNIVLQREASGYFCTWRRGGLLSRFKTRLCGFCHWSPADVMFPASSAVLRSGFLGSNVASRWLLNGLWQAASPPPWLHFSSKQPENEAAERSVQKADSTNTLQQPHRGRTSEETTQAAPAHTHTHTDCTPDHTHKLTPTCF